MNLNKDCQLWQTNELGEFAIFPDLFIIARQVVPARITRGAETLMPNRCSPRRADWILQQPLVLLVALSAHRATASELVVDTDFSGGSAHVVSIDQSTRTVRIKPADHPQRGWACWWYFRLSGIQPGETVTIEVGDAPWATPDRAATSVDNKSWSHTAAGTRHRRRITYRHRVDARQAWFAWGPPFSPDDAERLVRWAAENCPRTTAMQLCRTRGGRPVPAVRFAPSRSFADRPLGIWIQARQHAWEAGSSWVCRGLIEWLASDDPRAAALRDRAWITVVPIMDVDNVAIGAGGKNQQPQDHNRDWSDQPHWPSVRAAITDIKRLNRAGHFHLFVDLHNPGATSKHPFFFVPPDELLSTSGRENLDKFVTACRLEMTGPLAFKGQTIQSGSNYDKNWKAISKNWVKAHTNQRVVSVTLETAWNTPHSTTSGYRTVGRQLAQSIERYFREGE